MRIYCQCHVRGAETHRGYVSLSTSYIKLMPRIRLQLLWFRSPPQRHRQSTSVSFSNLGLPAGRFHLKLPRERGTLLRLFYFQPCRSAFQDPFKSKDLFRCGFFPTPISPPQQCFPILSSFSQKPSVTLHRANPIPAAPMVRNH
jgi:hypothetical protein